jgi:hypothetical protein
LENPKAEGIDTHDERDEGIKEVADPSNREVLLLAIPKQHGDENVPKPAHQSNSATFWG